MTRTIKAGLAVGLLALLATSMPAQATVVHGVQVCDQAATTDPNVAFVFNTCRAQAGGAADTARDAADGAVRTVLDSQPAAPVCLQEETVAGLAGQCAEWAIDQVRIPDPEAWANYVTGYSAALQAWEADSQGKTTTWAFAYRTALDQYRGDVGGYAGFMGSVYAGQVGAWANAYRGDLTAYGLERVGDASAYASGSADHYTCVVLGPAPCPPVPATPGTGNPPVRTDVPQAPLPPDAPQPLPLPDYQTPPPPPATPGN